MIKTAHSWHCRSSRSYSESSKPLLPHLLPNSSISWTDWPKVYWRDSLSIFVKPPRNKLVKFAVYYEDDMLLIMYDRYYKSKTHLLFLPKGQSCPDLPSALGTEQLPLLYRMREISHNIANDITGGRLVGRVDPTSPLLQFRAGFHAIPSLNPLHLHFISQDFDSPFLKNKKHYLSFNTPFFLSLDYVIRQIEELGAVTMEAEDEYLQYLKGPLVSHRSGIDYGNKFSLLKRELQESTDEYKANPEE